MPPSPLPTRPPSPLEPHPDLSASRNSAAPSLRDAYLASPSARTEPSFAHQQDLATGATTAHERPVSPAGSLRSGGGASEAGEAAGAGASGLRRRSSSTFRGVNDTGSSGAQAGSTRVSPGSGGNEEEEAVRAPRERTASDEGGAQQGWRTFSSPVHDRPAPRRSETVELSDGTTVRRLPSTPVPQDARANTLAASTSASSLASHSHGHGGGGSAYDDPFRASTSSSSAAPPPLFSPGYTVTSSAHTNLAAAALSRVDSHPLGDLARPASLASRPSFTSYDDEPTFAFGATQLEGEDDEEIEARSPLQPSHPAFPYPSAAGGSRTSTPNPSSSRRRSVLPVRSTTRRTPFLGGLTPSPSRRPSPHASTSPSGSPGDVSRRSLGAGWKELSPSPSLGEGYGGTPKGSALGRRGTLSAVAAGVRRISVRVVNLTGQDTSADEEHEGPMEGSGNGGQGSRRSSVQPPADRRASSATLAPPLGTDTSRIAEEHEPKAVAGHADEEADVGRPGSLSSAEGDSEEKSEEAKWQIAKEKREQEYRNNLRGKTLGMFGPDSRVRRGCARVLTSSWTEPSILLLIVLQVVILTVQSASNVYEHPRPTKGYFHTWEDSALFIIFVLFTFELAARILVTGLVFNPPLPPAPPPLKLDLYAGGATTPSRTPSIVAKIQSRLSPLPSPAQSPLPSPTRSRRSPLPSPTRPTPGPLRLAIPPAPPTDRLHPVPLTPTSPSSPISPVKDPGMYPPGIVGATGTDIASLSYSRYGEGLDREANLSAVSLVRDNSHSHSQQTAPVTPVRENGGIGLGLSSQPISRSLSARLRRTTEEEPDPSFSIRAALASSLPTAAGPASSAAYASSLPGGGAAGGYSSSTPYALAIRRQRQAYQQAFLRHSWARIDLVAVLSFWISFGLALKGWESERNLWVFRALSVMRATRLLAVTAGTQTILQSLKKAAPLLVDVGGFVAFAMVLFSIIGVQAFRGSYLRTCQWIDPDGLLANVTASDQHCGGFIDATTGNQTGYLKSNYEPSGDPPKGFICGAPSVCVETENPAGGAFSFDNIFGSLMQVFIIASANTWTDGMYAMMDSDFYVSCLFFIACLLVVNYWLFSLFVACITTTFGDIRDETKHSAFAPTTVAPSSTTFDDARKPHRAFTRSTSLVRKIYDKTAFVWVLAALASVAIQGAQEYGTPAHLRSTYERVELGLTLAFDVEIAIRVFASLPDWRSFFTGNANLVDTVLALVTTVLQIPGIKDSPAYPWLTCFQIARFYRVILFIPRMRRLLVRVLGTFTGLVNMVVFLLLMTFIASLVSVQLLRGVPDQGSDDTGTMNFFQIFNAFLAMYQVASSENWTDVLQTAVASQGLWGTVVAAIFLCGWMFFSFFILGNLFIAVINENFAIAEEEKRARQAEAFVNRNAQGQKTVGWFRRFDPYTYVTKQRSKSDARSQSITSEPVVAEPEELPDRNMTASPQMMEDSLDEKEHPPQSAGTSSTRFFRKAKKSIRFQSQSGFESIVNYVDPQTPEIKRSTYRHPRDGTIRSREATMQEQERALETVKERRNQIAEFIAEHPSYDKTLFLFPSTSPVRRFCQSLVDPSYGERINGRDPSPKAKRVFSAIVLAAIISSVAIAGVATPLYRREYYLAHGPVRVSWFNVVEASLGAIFFAEALVMWIADGVLFTPNAYLLSWSNDINCFVLITLLINISTSLLGGTSSSRFTRALKAFRALRLINLSPTIRTAFYNVLIVGAGRIMDASILAVLYIVPYAIWGQAVFKGLLYTCSDTSVLTKAECVGEYMAETVDGWTYMAPRVWANPSTWTFDKFWSSLLILFEIISLEGWIDVMESVMSISGQDRQPQDNASQWNALFFVLFNLVGATFILTLFVSLIIQNFTERTSASLLTSDQRQWLDLRRYLSRQHPSRRPKRKPSSRFRAWCFDRAVSKHGWWNRSVTFLYVLNILVLATQAETTSAADDARNYIFLGFTLLYVVDIGVRLAGLGAAFFQSGWNLYDLVVVSGTSATTILVLAGSTSNTAIQLQKLFLVSIVFKLVQRENRLNQLFKTAAASLPAILSIFALWLVLFLVFAIFYLELFGLTRWESAETWTSNYYTFWNAMVLLALQSTGEGWNEYMHNYTVEFPRCTNSLNYLFSDCGSEPGAYALFILWNILSMYLFVNLILGAVIENFSFVFQSYNKVTSINREQMRSFKKVWAQFDPERTGHLQPRDVGPFLHRLTSVFEVKIYRDEWSCHALQAGARRDPTEQYAASPAFVHYLADRDTLSLQRLDMDKLRLLLDGIDVEEVRQRREIFLHVYHEAKLEAESSLKGISFNRALMVIAHYRLIDDDMALQMDELVQRRQKQQIVTERVNMDKVHSFLRMVVLRRRYEAQKRAARYEGTQRPSVPAIHVVGSGLDSPSPVASPFAASMASPPPASIGEGDGEMHGDESVLETPSRGRLGPSAASSSD
ncbi:hypothetical protein JCM10213_006241 [Rhodosporidiobolus nylandii]